MAAALQVKGAEPPLGTVAALLWAKVRLDAALRGWLTCWTQAAVPAALAVQVRAAAHLAAVRPGWSTCSMLAVRQLLVGHVAAPRGAPCEAQSMSGTLGMAALPPSGALCEDDTV